jgi:hypothetical protein
VFDLPRFLEYGFDSLVGEQACVHNFELGRACVYSSSLLYREEYERTKTFPWKVFHSLHGILPRHCRDASLSLSISLINQFQAMSQFIYSLWQPSIRAHILQHRDSNLFIFLKHWIGARAIGSSFFPKNKSYISNEFWFYYILEDNFYELVKSSWIFCILGCTKITKCCSKCTLAKIILVFTFVFFVGHKGKYNWTKLYICILAIEVYLCIST